MVMLEGQLKQHDREKCSRDGSVRPMTRRGNRSTEFTKARQTFLQMHAERFKNKPFQLKCQCPATCNFSSNKNCSEHEFLSEWNEHFEAFDFATSAREVRSMQHKTVELEQMTEDLQERLREEQRSKQEAEHKLEAAKVVEQNSHHLISEQLAVNETLLQEAARLKLELKALNEVETSAQCVICRDAKPSRAFVPCGHVCVCSSCWDEFDRNSGRCPKCRRDIQFSFSVFI
ncbi:unnamed protein product [Cladocopium goreaui]|uniref:Probable E3 ubiquitin-protein ligase LUL4 (Probable RING-type E3 ubiquitin transferase LUL4) (Protein LOG2-LIKE UBIQUITIN LIGASE 4) (RING finger protein 208) n=1 Tax=Cladocopium goreaui TaxID=2562237 RepID=A0A9P1GJY4_9DINO|nr:unnamed protein product [Cladocopium goreaui]